MRAIILAAGYATRLYPLTLTTPKPLLVVGGMPIVDHLLSMLRPFVSKITLVTNNTHLVKFQTWAQGKNVVVVSDGSTSEQNRKGAVGSLAFGVQQQKESEEGANEGILVIAGDNFFSGDVASFVETYQEKNASCVALHNIGDPGHAKGKYGVVDLDKKGRIISFEEKPEFPKTTLVATAFYALTKEDAALVSEYVKLGHSADNLGNFIAWLVKQKPVYGITFDGSWFDIGTKEEYEKVNNIFRRE